MKIFWDAAALSSGTLATLTGFPSYEEIDKVQNEFLEFISSKLNAGKEFSTWIEAWNSFKR